MRDDSLYIPLHRGLPKSMKFRRTLRRLAGVTEEQLIGHLAKLWWASLDMADGRFTRCSAEDLEDAAGWQGAPGAFVAVLREEGWLDDADGADRVHEWERYPGAGLRLREAKRVQK